MKTTNRRNFLLGCAALAALATCPKSLFAQSDDDVSYYTCAMHPSVHEPKPGNCPICGMTLIPVMKPSAARARPEGGERTAGGERPTEFTIPLDRQQLIGVTYAVVEKKPLRRVLRASGLVASENERHWDIVSRVQGYVEKLIVNSPGDLVDRGQPLLTIYSPDLAATQHELVDLLRMRDAARRSGAATALQNANDLIASAEQRLRQWNVTETQIAELEQTRQARDNLELLSPYRGIIHHIHIEQGKDISVGTDLVDMADLSEVWVWADFFQDEAALLKPGLPVTLTTSACPNDKFSGKIAVIDAFLNDERRTIRVRLDIDNPDMKLRPDMYVDAGLQIDAGEGLTVPFGAVLPTGTRNVVFVDKGAGKLEPRFVELGAKFGDLYEVKSGLATGERVVSSANFLVDAESKIQGALKDW
ncbi:MAG: efflux RND transporter periplasmic adaptor subunit [Opitutaceae bacterium]|jgi:Cu(I)/Ag(I) efflux system membrane fusion protein